MAKTSSVTDTVLRKLACFHPQHWNNCVRPNYEEKIRFLQAKENLNRDQAIEIPEQAKKG